MVFPYEDRKISKDTTPGSARRGVPNSTDQLAQYEIDRRSAYFGNLPLDMTEEELREMAISCGQVVEVRLHSKPIGGGTGMDIIVDTLPKLVVTDIEYRTDSIWIRGILSSRVCAGHYHHICMINFSLSLGVGCC